VRQVARIVFGPLQVSELAFVTGVVQLIGQCHGFEPPQPDPDFGRVSYTQYEALYARQRGKKIWYLLLDDAFPADPHDPEPDEYRELQSAYRQRILSDTHLYHGAKDATELENRIHGLKNELAVLRRRFTQWATLVLVLLLVLVAGGVWLKHGQGRQGATIMDIKNQNDKLLAAMRELAPTLAQASQSGAKEDEQTRVARAYAVLEDKHKLARGTLAKELPQFAEQLLQLSDTSVMDRASALFAVKKFAEAEAVALEAKDKALAAGQRVQDAIAALELAGSAAWAQIHYVRALEHYRAAAALTSRQRDPVEWARVQHRIAFMLDDQGDYRQAVEVLGPVIETRQRVLGPEHPDTLDSRNNLAIVLDEQGKHAEAEKEQRAVLAIEERVLGPEHPDTLGSRNNLAIVLRAEGKYAEAEKEGRAVLAIRERVLGPEDRETLGSRNNVANTLYAQGKYVEAEKENRAVLAIRERVLGPEHPETLASRDNLASALDDHGKHVEAEQEHRAVLAIFERVLGPEHPDVFKSCYNLALCLEAQGKKPEALAFARRALAGLQRTLGDAHPYTKAAKELVGRLEQPQ
jgi:tetratricopeptide (TPR) repeat protein